MLILHTLIHTLFERRHDYFDTLIIDRIFSIISHYAIIDISLPPPLSLSLIIFASPDY
jgi:hypothetical protein